MIKAIIFDCFGVLTNGHWVEFWNSLPSPEMRANARDLHRYYDSGYLEEDRFINQLADLTARPISDIEKVFNDPNPHKNTDLIDFINTLKPTYKIGLLSNIASSWIEDNLLSGEEIKLFDDIVLSYKVHMIKPDPQIFILAADRLKVDPRECLLIDDSADNTNAAKDLGMKVITYSTFDDFKLKLKDILLNN